MIQHSIPFRENKFSHNVSHKMQFKLIKLTVWSAESLPPARYRMRKQSLYIFPITGKIDFKDLQGSVHQTFSEIFKRSQCFQRSCRGQGPVWLLLACCWTQPATLHYYHADRRRPVGLLGQKHGAKKITFVRKRSVHYKPTVDTARTSDSLNLGWLSFPGPRRGGFGLVGYAKQVLCGTKLLLAENRPKQVKNISIKWRILIGSVLWCIMHQGTTRIKGLPRFNLIEIETPGDEKNLCLQDFFLFLHRDASSGTGMSRGVMVNWRLFSIW